MNFVVSTAFVANTSVASTETYFVNVHLFVFNVALHSVGKAFIGIEISVPLNVDFSISLCDEIKKIGLVETEATISTRGRDAAYEDIHLWTGGNESAIKGSKARALLSMRSSADVAERTLNEATTGWISKVAGKVGHFVASVFT